MQRPANLTVLYTCLMVNIAGSADDLQLKVLILFLQVLLLWLSGRRATLQELLEAVESTSAAAGCLNRKFREHSCACLGLVGGCRVAKE